MIQFKLSEKYKKLYPLIFCVPFAVFGVMLLSQTIAATFSHFEPEKGTLANGATLITDSKASGGSAVQFNAPPDPAPSANGICPAYPAFPDEKCTGWQHTGVSLKAYGGPMTITTAGTVIDSMEISGQLTIKASNVTIKRSRITSGDARAILISSGTNIIIEDVEIRGQGCDAGIVGANYIATRINVYNCSDGFKASSAVTIKDSYIHDLYFTSTSHNDGVQVSDGSNITITHNRILIPNHNTSTVLIKADFGPISNVVVSYNYLNGGSYTVYSRTGSGGTPTGTQILNNVFGKDYEYGISSLDGSVTWSGNTWADTGTTAQ